MLAPALLLVVIVLGAIAVDLSLVHTARRSAFRTLSAAADDAAAMIDAREFQSTGIVRLDPDAAERIARAHLGLLAADGSEGFVKPAFEVVQAEVEADPSDGSVAITATVRIDHILLTAVPGMADTTTFDMSVTGRMI